MKDMSGLKFGRLTVIEFVGYDKYRSAQWKCKCDCGNEVIVDGRCLRRSNTKSCGCLNKDSHITHPNHKIHGMSGTRIYRIWKAMKARCSNQNDVLYGGRGIIVCDEWKSFVPFYKWAIKNGYDENKSIDRINVNGNYSPDNCRWSLISEQANNKRNNKRITINGETYNALEWSKITGVSYQTIWKRMKKGLSGEELIKKKGE